LEKGFYLKNFFPDLAISYKIDWNLTASDAAQADQLTSTVPGPRIGIYGSSYSTARAWGFWQAKEWYKFISMLHAKRPDITFYIIGAEWDMNLSQELIAMLKQSGIQYVDTVGRPLSVVMELMKRLNYAFYFPSGLAILSETLVSGTDCTMFYPPHLQPMMNKWADPQRIEQGNFKEASFCTQERIYDWVVNEYKLFDKI
jgi:protein associated with RNAse G/E